jgi:serine/threonine protein kinase
MAFGRSERQGEFPPVGAMIDFDPNSAPFNQFKDLTLLAKNRRGQVSFETARHHLYVGSDKKSHASVLIKITSRPGLIYQDNLENEIASLLKINRSIPESPYFPFVRAHGKVPDGRVYIVASFFDEFPLANAIGDGPIPGKTDTYIRTAMEIAKAFVELHSLKIYHVDLNPMNILLRLEHGRPIIRIIDFESSYEWDRHSKGPFYSPPNTPGYSAPEIAHRAPDARSDVFSLGAVLYTMLAGYRWTWDNDVWTCVKGDNDIDRDLKRIVLKAVDPSSDNRYRSMDEFRADLAVRLEKR